MQILKAAELSKNVSNSANIFLTFKSALSTLFLSRQTHVETRLDVGEGKDDLKRFSTPRR